MLAETRQYTLPFKRKSQGRRVTVKESVVQEQIELALRMRGYRVLSTSEHRKAEPCPHCGKYMTSKMGRGCDKGVPDLLVTAGPRCRSLYHRGVWIGLEVKGPKTPLSPEQKALLADELIFVVRSVPEALAAVRQVEEEMLGLPVGEEAEPLPPPAQQ